MWGTMQALASFLKALDEMKPEDVLSAFDSKE